MYVYYPCFPAVFLLYNDIFARLQGLSLSRSQGTLALSSYLLAEPRIHFLAAKLI